MLNAEFIQHSTLNIQHYLSAILMALSASGPMIA